MAFDYNFSQMKLKVLNVGLSLIQVTVFRESDANFCLIIRQNQMIEIFLKSKYSLA